jgi:hypothetical protein
MHWGSGWDLDSGSGSGSGLDSVMEMETEMAKEKEKEREREPEKATAMRPEGMETGAETELSVSDYRLQLEETRSVASPGRGGPSCEARKGTSYLNWRPRHRPG